MTFKFLIAVFVVIVSYVVLTEIMLPRAFPGEKIGDLNSAFKRKFKEYWEKRKHTPKRKR